MADPFEASDVAPPGARVVDLDSVNVPDQANWLAECAVAIELEANRGKGFHLVSRNLAVLRSAAAAWRALFRNESECPDVPHPLRACVAALRTVYGGENTVETLKVRKGGKPP